MRQWAPAALLTLGLNACAPTMQPPDPPVCGTPSVLREVDQIMRARGRPLVLDAPPAGQVSTDPSLRSTPLAHCSVRAHTVAYDTNRTGMSPVYEPFIVNYTIELRQNGMFVRVD